jgi:hypothetical protein
MEIIMRDHQPIKKRKSYRFMIEIFESLPGAGIEPTALY